MRALDHRSEERRGLGGWRLRGGLAGLACLLAPWAAAAQTGCPPTHGVYALAEQLGPRGAVLVEGDAREVATVITTVPVFITSDARGTIQASVIAQFGPMQALLRPKDGVPNGATVSLDAGFAKGSWVVAPGPLAPPGLRAVRRTHEQLPPNSDNHPAWRRWTLQIEGDALWVQITGPGGGAGLFPVQPNRQVHVEWGQCMRSRHSLPAVPGIYKVQAMDTAGDLVGPVLEFTVPR